MAFTFEKYGTFAGPSVNVDYRDNDDFSVEPFAGYFNLTDVSMVLANTTISPADFVYMHLAGTSTSLVTLERSTGSIPTFNVAANNTNFSNNVFVAGNLTGPTITDINNRISSKKGFDIPHPTKKDHRLRYICIEGPSAEVYFRGKLKDSNVIELPEYWRNLVDPETIGVTMTPVGSYQELFVERIEWGSRIIVKNNLSGQINCNFVVFAERNDTAKNVSEYQGLTPLDYPGDNEEYTINGY